MNTLADQYPVQQQRLRELLQQYEAIGPVGRFGHAMISDVLRRAEHAAASGDTAAMLRGDAAVRVGGAMTQRERINEYHRLIWADAVNSKGNIYALLEQFAQQIRQETLEEAKEAVKQIIGKDSGNWNRAIVYAVDTIRQLGEQHADRSGQ